MARTDIQMNIRIPELLKAMLEGAAAQAGRSVTSEVVYRLEASFPENLIHLLIIRREEEVQMVQHRLAKSIRFASRLEAAGATDDLASIQYEIAFLQDHLTRLEDDLHRLTGDLTSKRIRHAQSEPLPTANPSNEKARTRRA